MRAITFELSEEIRLPVSRVWEIMTNPSLIRLFDRKNRIKSIQFPAQLESGTRITIELRMWRNLVLYVDLVEPNHTLVFHYKQLFRQKTTFKYQLKSILENKTRVNIKIDFNTFAAPILRVFQKFIQAKLAKDIKAYLVMAENMTLPKN